MNNLVAALAAFFMSVIIFVDPVQAAESMSYGYDIETLDESIEAEVVEGQKTMMATLIMAEAGGCSFEQKCLVADVIFNRVADPRFPDTIEEVINQPGQFGPMTNGAYERASQNVTEDCFLAVEKEWIQQINYSYLYFWGDGKENNFS